MYTLLVIHAGASTAAELHHVEKAADALTAIQALLERHDECDRVVVMHGPVRLFSVDCKGNRLPD